MIGILAFLALVVPAIGLLVWVALTRGDQDLLPAESATDLFSSMGPPGGGI